LPGGGYSILAIDKEGTKVAEEFNKWGITAFVLKYRLPDDSLNVDKSLAPLQDAQQAIRLVRANAKEWGVNKNTLVSWDFQLGDILLRQPLHILLLKQTPRIMIQPL
jgi:acetyl esterase/lipase